MIKGKTIATKVFIIFILLSITLNACKNRKKTSYIKNLSERVVSVKVDSIGHRDPIWPSFPSDEVRLIDIKLINDTIYLFSLVYENDSVRLYTYYWNEVFHPYKTYTLNISSSRSEEERIKSLAAISLDTLLLVRLNVIDEYCILSGIIHYSHRLNPGEILPGNFSPVQYCKKSRSVFSEYINYNLLNKDNRKTYNGSMFSEFSISRSKLMSLPFTEPPSGKFRSQYAKSHFVVTEDAVIVKYNFNDEFEVYDRIKMKSYRKATRVYGIAQNKLPKDITTDADQIGDFYTHNASQEGMVYNQESGILYLFYTMPLPERCSNGLKTNPNDKPLWIIVFDHNLEPKERIIISDPGFWASMQFAVEDKIFLLSNRLIYTIKL